MLDRQTVNEELKQAGHHTHGLAALFPLMSADEFAALKASIEQNGQREPALLWGSLILDGVHRTLACVQLGIKPRFVNFSGTGQEARARVLDLNLHRRHLSVGQRAMIAADLAQRKQGEGGDSEDASLTQSEAAAMMSVGERSVRLAKRLTAEAAPRDVEAVRSGKVSLNAAASMFLVNKPSGPNGRQVEEEKFDTCRQCKTRHRVINLHDDLCIDCRNRNLVASQPHDCTQCGKRTDGGLLADGVCLDCRHKQREPIVEPAYTYECFLCSDELQEDEVAWLNELPCCPACFAQADPGDDPDDEEETDPSLPAEETAFPAGWQELTPIRWEKAVRGFILSVVNRHQYDGVREYHWAAEPQDNAFIVQGNEVFESMEAACAAAEDWHRVWIVAAHGEAAPNALIDTPAAYTASENEFMGGMGDGESMDDVVGV